MFCKSCGKNIPDESTFCPYCMTKFTEEQKIDNKSSKNGNNIAAILAIVLVIILVIAVVTTVVCIKLFKTPENEETGENVTATTSDVAQTTQPDSLVVNGEQTEVGTTTTTQNMNNDQAILNAYVKQVLETLNLLWYYVYDMDNNGVYELIIMSGTYEGDFTYHFYTYRDGQIEYIDSDSARYSALFVPLSGKGILNVYARQETLVITEITLNGKVFSKEKLLETQIGYSEDYWDYEKDYASGKLIGCQAYDPVYAEYIFELGYEAGSEKWSDENPIEY